MAEISFLKDPKGWTLDVLFREMRKVHAAALQERARLSMNNAAVIALGHRADAIQDPVSRATAQAEVKKLYNRQVAIAGMNRAFASAWSSSVNAVGKFLKMIGVAMPSGLAGESGLGVVQLVPILVAGAVILASLWVARIVIENNSAEKTIAAKDRVLAMLEMHSITPEQADAMMKEIDKSTPPPAGDPLGLSELLKQAGPVLLMVGAIVIVPPLLETFNRRPRRNPSRHTRRRLHRASYA